MSTRNERAFGVAALAVASLLEGCSGGNCGAACAGGVRISLHGMLAAGDLVTPVRVCLNEDCAVVLAGEDGIVRHLTDEIELAAWGVYGIERITEWTVEVAPKGAKRDLYRDGDVVTIELFEPSVTPPQSATELGKPVKTLRWVVTYERRDVCGDECLGVDLEADLQGHSSTGSPGT